MSSTSNLQDAVADAHISWLCNTTTGDSRWRLKQLHGLHQLLLANRDDLVSALTNKSPVPPLLLERELALLVQDLAAHISNLTKQASAKPARPVATPWGAALTAAQPLGVSVLLTGSPNPFRHALAPLAASIAAGNVVVLANLVVNATPFFSILEREISKYMDSFSIQILSYIRIPTEIPSEVSQVAVFDTSPEEFSEVLSAENAVFYSTRPGHNLAVVDAGTHSVTEIAQQILDSYPPLQFPGDALSAVFIPQEEMAVLCQSLVMSDAPGPPDAKLSPEYTHISGITPLTSNIFRVDLSEHVPGKRNSGDLSEVLELVKNEVLLAIIAYSSLDQVLDSIGKVSEPIQQIALVSPAFKTTEKYFEKWTKSAIVSVGSIRPVIPTAISHLSALDKDTSLTIFPSSMFARPRAIFNTTPTATLSAALLSSPVSTTIDTIRSSYEGKIPALLPEPRGERIGFFVQVEYVIKGVAATIGVAGLVGLWFGGKAVKRYFDHR